MMRMVRIMRMVVVMVVAAAAAALMVTLVILADNSETDNPDDDHYGKDDAGDGDDGKDDNNGAGGAGGACAVCCQGWRQQGHLQKGASNRWREPGTRHKGNRVAQPAQQDGWHEVRVACATTWRTLFLQVGEVVLGGRVVCVLVLVPTAGTPTGHRCLRNA